MARTNKKETIIENLTVQAVAAEGKSIAHTEEGQVVFIEYAVPGDVVDIRVTVKKKKSISDSAAAAAGSFSPIGFSSKPNSARCSTNFHA